MCREVYRHMSKHQEKQSEKQSECPWGPSWCASFQTKEHP